MTVTTGADGTYSRVLFLGSYEVSVSARDYVAESTSFTFDEDGDTAEFSPALKTGVAEITGGRFENIAAPNRLATLLPEIGTQVARSHELQRQQYRITVQRPDGATGDVSKVSISAFGGLAVDSVSFDGRVRD